MAGLGQHTVQVGNGSNILIDGSVQLTQTGDTLGKVLADWTNDVLNDGSNPTKLAADAPASARACTLPTTPVTPTRCTPAAGWTGSGRRMPRTT